MWIRRQISGNSSFAAIRVDLDQIINLITTLVNLGFQPDKTGIGQAFNSGLITIKERIHLLAFCGLS